MSVSGRPGDQGVGEPDSSVIVLGTAAALAGYGDAHTYLAVVRRGRYWLVDCADGPIGRLQHVGIDPLAVRGIIITHFHPDHVFGLPVYLMGLYLLGLAEKRPRREPVALYAPVEALQLVRAMVGLFQLQSWMDMFRLEYHPIESRIGCLVAEDEDFTIVSTPTHHSVSSIAVRFAVRETSHSMVYSSDTAPCPEVEALAWGADLLVHEASGPGFGHSSASEAGAVAARASAARLLLVHYYSSTKADLLGQAQSTFSGPVEIAEELTAYPW